MNIFQKFTVTTIVIGIIGAYLYYNYAKKHTLTDNKSMAFRIAIFEPASHPAMDEIVDGFTTTIQKNSPVHYLFKRYNANGNKNMLRAQAEEIIQQQYELIMTIGADPTRTIHELTTKKKLTTPVVFDAVSDPVGLGIISSLQSSGNNLTGVEEAPDYTDQINKLLMVKPSTKTILLVFDPIIKAGIHEQWAQEIKQIAQNKGINVIFAQVFQTNEIQAKVQQLLPQTDVIMILTDHTTVSGVDSLITLCNRYNVTLYASDLNSGQKGAALAYGTTQYDLGVEAAQLALEILVNYRRPRDISIQSPKTKILQINRKTMEKQGLKLSDTQEKEIIRNGGIFI